MNSEATTQASSCNEDQMMWIRQMRWRCRRGIKEVEMKIGAYFEHNSSQLYIQAREAFEQLLQCDDADLMLWLLSEQRPDPDGHGLARLIDDIRRFDKT